MLYGPAMPNYTEQTHGQADAIRAEIRRLGVPTRESTDANGVRYLEWRIGARRFSKYIDLTGKVS